MKKNQKSNGNATGAEEQKEIELKCVPIQFAHIIDGTKPFELRYDDWNFKVGDTLRLREFEPLTDEYSGREIKQIVTHITRGFGLWTDWVCMGLSAPSVGRGNENQPSPLLSEEQLTITRLSSELEQAREALRRYDFAPWKPPFRYDDLGSHILDSENRMIVDVRGWGFLTGAGGAALKLHEEDARDIQDRLGEHVTKLLNLTSVGRGTVAGAPPVNPESALVSSLREMIEQQQSLLWDIRQSHCDPNDCDYNDCDKDPCEWCRRASALAAASPKASEKKWPQHLAQQIVDDFNQVIRERDTARQEATKLLNERNAALLKLEPNPRQQGGDFYAASPRLEHELVPK